MKKFIIINGLEIYFIKKKNLKEAVTFCQNYMNCSDEIIVREYNNINK